MGDGSPSAGSGLVAEAARKGLTNIWGTPSLEAAGLGQVHGQIGDRDESLVREITKRDVSERLRIVAMWGREEADAEGGKRSVVLADRRRGTVEVGRSRRQRGKGRKVWWSH